MVSGKVIDLLVVGIEKPGISILSEVLGGSGTNAQRRIWRALMRLGLEEKSMIQARSLEEPL